MSDQIPSQKPSDQTSEPRQCNGGGGVPVEIVFFADPSLGNASPKTFSYDAVLFSTSNQSLPTGCPVYLNEEDPEGWATVDYSGGKKIWLCRKEDIASINRVAKSSEKNRAAAVIVVKKPEELIHVPVIVLKLRDAVSLPSLSDGSYKATVKMNEDAQLSENIKKSFWGSLKTKSKDMVISAFGSSEKPPTELQMLFQASKDWSLEDNFHTFKTAMEFLSEACHLHKTTTQQKDGLAHIEETLCVHMKQKKYEVDILLLEYAAHVCEKMRTRHMTQDQLHESIWNAISKLSPSDTGPKLREVVATKSYCKEHGCVIVKFLKNSLSSKTEKMENVILVNIIWVYAFHCSIKITDYWELLLKVAREDFELQQDTLKLFMSEIDVNFFIRLLQVSQEKSISLASKALEFFGLSEKPPTKWEFILNESNDWSIEEDFLSFKVSMEVLAKTAKTRESELLQIGETLVSYMKQKSYIVDILLLEFSAEVCNRMKPFVKNHAQLQDSILKGISHYDHCTNGPKLASLSCDVRKEPGLAMLKCLSTNLDSTTEEMGNEILMDIIWMYVFHCNTEITEYVEKVSKRARTDFFESQSSIIRSFMSEIDVNTLGLHLQHSLKGFCELCKKFAGEPRAHSVSAHALLCNHLLKLIDNELSKKVITSFPCQEIECLLDATALIKFANDDECKDKIATKLLFCFDRSYRNFKMMDELLETLSLDNPHYDLFRKKIMNHVCQSLNKMSVSRYYINNYDIDTIQSLFHFQGIGRLLVGSDEGKRAILAFADEAINSRTTKFEVKFALLAVLYDAFVVKKWATCPETGEDEVRRLLAVLFSCKKSLDILVAAIKCGDQRPTAFVDPKGVSPLLDWLANEIVSNKYAIEIFCDPKRMENLIIDYPQAESKSLLSSLMRKLTSALVSQCNCIEKALCLFQSWYSKIDKKPHFLAQIAELLLVAYFDNKWTPTTITNLFEVKSQELEKFYRCLVKEERTEPRNACLDKMVSIISKWQHRLYSDNITKKEVREEIAFSGTTTWKILETIFDPGSFSPLKEELNKKLEKFKHLECSLLKSSLLPDANGESYLSILALLRHYNATESPLTRILSKYSQELTLESPINETSNLLELQRDFDLVQEYLHKHNDALRTSAFFMQTPSVLFRDALGYGKWRNLSTDQFFEKVRNAKKLLHDIFLETENVAIIIEKAQVISDSARDWRKETLVVRSCPGFEIKEADTDRFCIIAMISNCSDLLQQFLNCCQQLSFGFVNADPLFFKLCKKVEDIAVERAPSFSVARYLDITSQVVHILFPDLNIDATTGISDQYHSLLRCLPMLNFFGTLSQNSDVWAFVRDMKWFGEIGLQVFYQSHENVTNMFLGDSKSYETSVLNSVEACVRYLSHIGDLSSLSSFDEFLRSIHKIDTEQIALDDLVTMQKNLSSIREWFTNGMDDIAATFGTFKRISATGEYFLRNSSCGTHVSELCLRYQDTDNASSDSKKIMELKHLNEFVERLGFIQHESESMSKLMESFIEQHHAILRAANNLYDMSSLGFPSETLRSFSFKVYEQTLSDAKELVAMSYQDSLKCDRWLESIYDEYPLSLLYWMEELVENHKDLTISLVNDMALHRLAHASYRLLRGECNKHFCCNLAVQSIKSFSSVSSRKHGSWLIETSEFLQFVHRDVCGDKRNSFPYPSAIPSSKIGAHTLSCNHEMKKNAILNIFKHVYMNRLPMEFEVIDGKNITSQKINIFLKRAAHFSDCTYIVLNTDQIAGNLQETILSFLSDENAARRVRIHFVQCRPTLIDASPRVEPQNWDDKKLREIDSHSVEDWFRTAVLNKAHVNGITIVATEGSGTGKTRFIREKLTKLQIESKAQIGLINIHEGTTLRALVAALKSKFPQSGQKNAAYFSFSFMCADSSVAIDLTELVNEFFMSLLVLRYVHDPNSASSFYLGEGQWEFFVELQELPKNGNSQLVHSKEWLKQNIPILSHCGQFVEPTSLYAVDEKAHRVCTYLRAFKDGTINRKFCPHSKKCLLFMLDESGSMHDRNKLGIATDNALKIFDSHVLVNDMIGLITFDGSTRVKVPLQCIRDDDHKFNLKEKLDCARNGNWGGTYMYKALDTALSVIMDVPDDVEIWIICLTDGESSDDSSIVESRLCASRDNVHVILIGVDLCGSLYGPMQALCRKFGPPGQTKTKGFFIPTVSELDEMNNAFQSVANIIPVSQTFQLDGELSNEDCRHLMKMYLPKFIAAHDMLLQSFWIQLLYRRVKVFDENQEFNYNKTHDSLGSSLMDTMLFEVEQFLREDQVDSWSGKNHQQLIYDFADKSSPEFRLVCTAPEKIDLKTRKKYESLNLPGFIIPTSENLEKRSTLDQFLSQALDLPLVTGKDGQKRLQCIDDNGFVLTLDFTMKLLSMHERIACRVPCILEGETGVSKTALTKMYSILVNSRLSLLAEQSTASIIANFETQLKAKGFSFEWCTTNADSLIRLQEALFSASERTVDDETCLSDLFSLAQEEGFREGTTAVARELFVLLKTACDVRCRSFQAPPSEYLACGDGDVKIVSKFLEWFAGAFLEPTFFEINVHASLTEADVLHYFNDIRASAKKLKDSQAAVVVFLDEVNTSSIIGLFKEIIIDHSICGDKLEENIVIVAACNPARKKEGTSDIYQLENDLGKEWASGHYQVSHLPASVAKLKWTYGSLTAENEKKFVKRRIEMLGHNIIPRKLVERLSALVVESQESIRYLAAAHIRKNLKHVSITSDIELRAASTVSLRDIQRIFSFFHFFSTDLKLTSSTPGDQTQKYHHAMLLAIAVVYYLRLDAESRAIFLARIQKLPTEQEEAVRLQDVLNNAMDVIISNTEIPLGIAWTRGLKENIFMTLVCSLSQTPLMIIGPPGSSKTLSVNIVADNANGLESPKKFYRNYPRLTVFHYQCSKASTSKDIKSVFEKAIQRQRKVNPSMQKCIVFMDEAGLPEEKRESMKVLHYFLEGHMSAKADVGFIAVTNHVLDAAKSNRCVTLHRQEPDCEELHTIARSILFDAKFDGSHAIQEVKCNAISLPPDCFVVSLCQSYTRLIHDEDEFKWFGLFFGMRDFIYFLRDLSMSAVKNAAMEFSMKALVYAIERNFNGKDQQKLKDVVVRFIGPILQTQDGDVINANIIHKIVDLIRHPMDVVREAILNNVGSRTRFKLIIDETKDDSIMRLLRMEGALDISKRNLFKLSCMPEGEVLEQSRLVSGVKYAAQQGLTIVLSQTEQVHESFYDLFNQNFRSFKNRDGQISHYANIAIGGISRRSLVHQSFQCIVHIKQSSIEDVPAPFLNRFEKFCVTVRSVLDSGWGEFPGLAKIIIDARTQVAKICSLLGANGIFGWIDLQTLDSIFVDMLPQNCTHFSANFLPQTHIGIISSFTDCIIEFIHHFTSLAVSQKDLNLILQKALQCLPMEDSIVLESLMGPSPQIKDASMKDAFHSVAYGGLETSLSRVIRIVVQMFVTKIAAFRLMLLVTPETVFACRTSLPTELIEEYFRQKHFSLKSYIERHFTHPNKATRPALHILHTRTNGTINSLASLPIDHNIRDVHQRRNDIRDLVCESLDRLVIEHFCLLRNETSIRSVIDSWAIHQTKHLFLLIVDMSHQHSTNSVNFIRTLVEQHDLIPEKKIMLLLHYPSSLCRNACYPALFLGGWRHIFLDEVGADCQRTRAHNWIESACKFGADGSIMNLRQDISSFIERALKYAASQRLFYPGQTNNDDSFSGHLETLKLVMSKEIEGATICDIFSEMIIHELMQSSLLSTLKQASESLLHGRTQLSMTSALQSMFQEKINILLASLFSEANQWRNVDILFNSNCCDATDKLFVYILRSLPVTPSDELSLHRNMKGRLHPIPCNISPSCQLSVKFPFFFFVSAFLDQAVDMAEAMMASNSAFSVSQLQTDTSAKQIFAYAIDILKNDHFDALEKNPHLSQNQEIIVQVIDIVEKDESNTAESLFQRYLLQYLQWKLGCAAESMVVVAAWMLAKISDFGESVSNNILSIHIVAKKYELELTRLALWTEYSEFPLLAKNSPISRFNAGDAFTLGGMDLLQSFIQHFENSSMMLLDSSPVWVSTFSSFFCQIRNIVGDSPIDPFTFMSLRALTLLHILATVSAPLGVIESVISYYYGVEKKRNTMKSIHLDEFVELIEGHSTEKDENSWLEKCIHLLLLRFFSSPWADLLYDKLHDFTFLLNWISLKRLTGQRQLASLLLRNALLATCEYTKESTSTLNVTGISHEVLLRVAGRFDCKGLQLCLDVGRHHFVPDWLIGEELEIRTGRKNATTSNIDFFFSNFRHVKCCPLANAMFDVILINLLHESRNATSEQLLLKFMCSIDDEYNITKKYYFQAGESKTDNDMIPLAMITDARLFCFVAKLSHEFAMRGSQTAAFCGSNAELGGRILESVMLLKGYKWQDFFFNNIIRVGGLASLLQLFFENCALHSFLWCKPWVVAARKLLSISELQTLKTAEENLRKSLRNRHARLFGHVVHDLGADQLSAQISTMYDNLSQCEMISKALGMNVPVLLRLFEKDEHIVPFVPSSFLMANTAFSGTPTEEAIRMAMGIVYEERANIDSYLYLPDLIEFYCWIHTNLRFLVTKEQAAKLKISTVMNEGIISRRFDAVSSSHIVRLWKRTCRGFEAILKSKRCTSFDGQDVHIPFERLEEASLLMLLSQGDHTSSSHDYLLLIIHDIIRSSNSFSERLHKIFREREWGEAKVKEINPKFLLRGSIGAVAACSLDVNSIKNLVFYLESMWCSERNVYDFEKLPLDFQETFSALLKRPIILNPLSFLREPFQFRDHFAPRISSIHNAQASYKSVTGVYFVRIQDVQLFDDVVRSLIKLHIEKPSTASARAFSVNFHRMDYDSLRSLLEGLRTSLEALPASTKDRFITYREAISSVIKIPLSEDSILEFFGFPRMTETQSQCILSLELSQVHEFAIYLGRQIASEAYLFSGLPLCMTDPLPLKAVESLLCSFGLMCERNPQAAIKSLDQFSKDLSDNEREICQVSSTNQSLLYFLETRNLCDESRCPFFAIIPQEVRINNYISLRQQLQQMKLEMLSKHSCTSTLKTEKEYETEKPSCFKGPLAVKSNRGQCWLWDGNYKDESFLTVNTPEIQPEISLNIQDDSRLWFEGEGSDVDYEAEMLSPESGISRFVGVSDVLKMQEEIEMCSNRGSQSCKPTEIGENFDAKGFSNEAVVIEKEENGSSTTNPMDSVHAYQQQAPFFLIQHFPRILWLGIFSVVFGLFWSTLKLETFNIFFRFFSPLNFGLHHGENRGQKSLQIVEVESEHIHIERMGEQGKLMDIGMLEEILVLPHSTVNAFYFQHEEQHVEKSDKRNHKTQVVETIQSLDMTKKDKELNFFDKGFVDDMTFCPQSPFDLSFHDGFECEVCGFEKDSIHSKVYKLNRIQCTEAEKKAVNLIKKQQNEMYFIEQEVGVHHLASQNIDETNPISTQKEGKRNKYVELGFTEDMMAGPQSPYYVLHERSFKIEEMSTKHDDDRLDAQKFSRPDIELSVIDTGSTESNPTFATQSVQRNLDQSVLYRFFYKFAICFVSILCGLLGLLFATSELKGRISPTATEHQRSFNLQTPSNAVYANVSSDENIDVSKSEHNVSLITCSKGTKMVHQHSALDLTLKVDEAKAENECHAVTSSQPEECQAADANGSIGASKEIDSVTVGSLTTLGISCCGDLLIDIENLKEHDDGATQRSPTEELAKMKEKGNPVVSCTAEAALLDSGNVFHISSHADRSWVEVNETLEKDINKFEQWQPLHFAALGGHVYGIENFIQEGADINALTLEDETPLDIAIQTHGENHPISQKLRDLGGVTTSLLIGSEQYKISVVEEKYS